MTEKEFEALKKKVDELEKQIKQKSLNMFGRSYSQVGSSSSDFLIKTRGAVKIQWGNKFIDLIKNGKLNVESKFIYTTQNKDTIGIKDGIYITEDSIIYLKIGDTILNLAGEVGTTYVSFMETQETTPEQKYNALRNIGFIYDSIQNVDNTALQNGLIYVTSEKKLYIVSSGQLQELTFSIPNPFTDQIIIQKSNDKTGSVVIKGQGIQNSLVFDTMYLYSSATRSNINSDNSIDVSIRGNPVLTISSSGLDIIGRVVSSKFMSPNANESVGFRLYNNSEGSTLEVDNLIVRNGTSQHTFIFPEFWSNLNNVISSFTEEDTGVYEIVLRYPVTYQIGDYIYTYGEITNDSNEISLIKIPLQIDSINNENNSITTSLVTGIFDEADNITDTPDLNNQITFLISTGEKIQQIKYSKDSIDLLEYETIQDEQEKESVKSRFGKLANLEKVYVENKEDQVIEGFGLYSDELFIKEARYIKDYELPIEDNSSKLVTTEWIHKLLPKGSIIMFDGSSSIPEGWAICDGKNGTPNLVGKFIKADNIAGNTGGSNEVKITIDNLPSHDHRLLDSPIETSSAGEHSHTYDRVYNTEAVRGWRAEDGDTPLISAYSGNLNDDSSTSLNLGHTHTVNLQNYYTSSTGNGDPLNIEPSYYTLIYIIKII